MLSCFQFSPYAGPGDDNTNFRSGDACNGSDAPAALTVISNDKEECAGMSNDKANFGILFSACLESQKCHVISFCFSLVSLKNALGYT